MTYSLIGIDCAIDESQVGLAYATYEEGHVTLLHSALGSRPGSVASTVSNWLKGTDTVLIAVDAPLGWPKGLCNSLITHRAGEAIKTNPHRMFRRATDHYVQDNIKKTPLDVGADRIARTAHAALTLLGDIRNRSHTAIPLAWDINIEQTSVIEVYPAATLKVWGIRSSGYKDLSQTAERSEIVGALARMINVRDHREVLTRHPDILDAAVCVLAARDFLMGHCGEPVDPHLARREGWIWVKSAPKVRSPN